ncbi:MAG: hypothetical protein BM558_12655 [Roseobacter sp. MedPE-SW]|nr:MAG: hypothetical protein BM558_12655 [Roseobacter sp. MedPE-SW]
MPALTLFHTAQIHVATFNALAPQAELTHVVREDWLERAQGGIDAELEREIKATLQAVKDPVLCSCTTIGEVAEAAGATRIDWPMMQQAVQIGGPVLLAYCLDSTLEPSSALLRRAFLDANLPADFLALDLTALWPLFETGDTQAFAEAIASAITTEVKARPDIAAVVLAQASMREARAACNLHLEIPVLASPEIALQTLLPEGTG